MPPPLVSTGAYVGAQSPGATGDQLDPIGRPIGRPIRGVYAPSADVGINDPDPRRHGDPAYYITAAMPDAGDPALLTTSMQQKGYEQGTARDPDEGDAPHSNLGPAIVYYPSAGTGPGLRVPGVPRPGHPIGYVDNVRPWKGRENGTPGNSDGTHVLVRAGADTPTGQLKAPTLRNRGNTVRVQPVSPSSDEYYGFGRRIRGGSS